MHRFIGSSLFAVSLINIALIAGAVFAAKAQQVVQDTTRWPLSCADFPPSEWIPCNKPSTDTTPVEIKWLTGTWIVPRNYVVDFNLPTFRATYPNYEGLTIDNADCFTPKARFRKDGCTFLEFHLLWGGDNETSYRNYRTGSLAPAIKDRGEVFGYHVTHVGPEDSHGTDTYYKRMNGYASLI